MRINPYRPLPYDEPATLQNPLAHIQDARTLAIVRNDLFLYVNALRDNLQHSPDGLAALDGVTHRLDAWLEQAEERAGQAKEAAEAGCFRLAVRAAVWWMWGRWR